MGWIGFGGSSHQSPRCEYDYRVVLHADGSTNKLTMPIDSYSTYEDVAVGA